MFSKSLQALNKICNILVMYLIILQKLLPFLLIFPYGLCRFFSTILHNTLHTFKHIIFPKKPIFISPIHFHSSLPLQSNQFRVKKLVTLQRYHHQLTVIHQTFNH
ncbi:hypothetical protein Hanom_Chr00s059400g01784591 [Helianthus anomalus]